MMLNWQDSQTYSNLKLGSRVRTCCVPNCEDKESRRFMIRTNQDIRNIWIQRIGNSRLMTRLADNYRICASHFDPICFDEGGKLLKFSLPTINLPGFKETSSKENCFLSRPCPASRRFSTPERIKKALSGPSSEHRSALVADGYVGPVTLPHRLYTKKKLFKTSEEVLLKDEGIEQKEEIRCSSATVVGLQCIQPSQNITRPSKSLSEYQNYVEPSSTTSLLTEEQKQIRRINLKFLGVTREKNLSPESRVLYQEIKKLKRIIHMQNISKRGKSPKYKHLSSQGEYLYESKLSIAKNTKINERGRNKWKSLKMS